ncbi:uncharacterized protein [Euphorbia lathyris]|uniref:uncharacterized protein n=1 Tax=Euphorbia lathyris TaxID=212925 RepID=UPI0033134F80
MAVTTSLAGAAASKVANEAVDSVWRQIGYIWNYKTNIDDFQQQLLKLKAERQNMLHSVDEARRNGEEIEDTTTIWLKSADDAIEAAEEILNGNDTSKKRCFMGCCPNFKARHQFSRKAKKDTPGIAQVQRERNSILKISNRLDVQAMEPVKNYEALESRMEVLKDIIGALKSDDINLIGVYGLGGVDKTTLVKQQVIAQVKEEGIFKMVAIANVTHIWELSRIQQEIADWLGLKFHIESIEVRAATLRARLKQEEKVLIVLDDIWEPIEMEKIGIPDKDDHEGCKVLMTSRDLNVLLNMDVQRHFLLQVLQENEAWKLFEKKAGDFKNSKLQSIAIKVARRCAGLPVLIMAVATSLRDKELYEWNDALEHLQKFADKGMDAQVYSALEWSYKFLGDDHKSLFILCAQASESIIPITYLVKYAKGLGLFQKCTTIRVLRDRLLKVVNDLKRSCFLMEGDNNEFVRMHDVVRNFATVIASKQHHVFIVPSQTELQEWSEDTFERCTAISLLFCNIPKLPQVLECPKLESLILSNGGNPSLRIPENFFSRTKKLKLLDLTHVNLLPLPFSLGFLQNIQALCLNHCVLEDISAVGQLNKLQVLSLVGSNIVQLPMEIRNLTRLQLLDLGKCRRLVVIPPGILNCLTKLEELSMLGSFVQWEGEGHSGKRNNASLSELKTLSNLINLEIHISDAKIMPVDLFHAKLERFKIVIGDNQDYYGNHGVLKLVKLKINDGFELERVKVLFIETEYLCLDDIKGVENVLPKLERQGFPELKHLQIQNCHEMQFIIDTTRMCDIISFRSLESLSLLNLNKLENICYGAFAITSFNNLRKLKVGNCNALKNMFSFSMFRCLVQLQEINVSKCEILKEIVAASYEDETIKLTQLEILTLENLPQLEGFCSPTNGASAEILLVDEFENLFSKKIQFPNLVKLKLLSIKVEKIWHNLNTEFCPFDKLTTIIVQGCQNLTYVLTSLMVRSLAQLKKFEIRDCKSMEEVIRIEGEIEEKMIFPKLNHLFLGRLPKVVNFCKSNLIKFPNMEELRISGCPCLQTFVSTGNEAGQQQDSSTLFDEKVDFPNLEQLVISTVHRMKVIWGNELREDSFRRLKGFVIENAKGLVKVFAPNLDLTRFQNLESLCIDSCKALTGLFDIRCLIGVKNERGVSQLKILKVFSTPNLKYVWNEDPKGILDFHNLIHVNIRRCSSLKCVFPVSIARGLVNLEKLHVLDSAIKEIVAGDEERIQGATVFEFPRLKELRLRRLSQLETFYPGTHTLEWPALQQLYITECYQFHIFTLSFKKIIPNLEEVALNGKEVRRIREAQLPAELFHRLKLVDFDFFDEESAVFPYDLLHIFRNLGTLKVSNSKLKELFPPQGVLVGDEMRSLILTRMHSLELFCLRNLKTIWNQVLQTLQTLIIKFCDSLIILAPSSASFQSLTSLDICDCRGLVSLVTFSTATSLMQLQSLRVRNCIQVKVIVSDEGDEAMNEINFVKLKTLVLDCLPNLTSFCLGNHIFKFPCLTKVVVNQCPNMEFFSKGISSTPMLARVQRTEVENTGYWLGNLNSTMSFLYKKMFGFQGLRHLTLSEFSNLKDRWDNELPLEIFCDLNSLVIDEVAFSSYSIPSSLLEHLNKLEKLEVANCELLEEVFDLQEWSDETQEQRELLPKLNRFHLINLPKLRQVWNEHLGRILNFKHLQLLKVHNCCRLRMIFTPSMAQGLVQLQKMEVKKCVSVEEIISKGAKEDGMINFPMLNSLVLHSLPKLTVFRAGRGIVHCPSLKKIAVIDCPKVEVFTSTADEEPEQLNYDGISIFYGKVKFRSLKGLRVDWNNNMKKILAESHDLFCSLEFVKLKHFPIEYSSFPSRFLERSPNLEKLFVSDASFEELFSEEVTFNEEESLKKVTPLRGLTLSKLPLLRYLIKDQNVPASLIQHLEALQVLECTKLTILVPSSISFENLLTLKVSKCHGLLSLITSSTARSLSQLARLEITECEMVEEIVASEGDEVEAEISFNQLKHLELHSLPKLTRFCSGNESFNFPSLEQVIVRECLKMEIFVQGELSVPNLESIQTTEDENEWCWDGSLNATIQHLFKQTIAKKVEEQKNIELV